MSNKAFITDFIMLIISLIGCYTVGKIFGFVAVTKAMDSTGKK